MGRLYSVGFSIVIVVALGIGATFALKHFIHSPLNDSLRAVKYTLQPGVGANLMIYQLKKQGVLNKLQAPLLCWWVKFQGLEKSLKAGEYLIPLSITPEKLIDKITKGDVIQYSFTMIEGSTFNDILRALLSHPSLKKLLPGKSTEEIMALLGVSTSLEGQFFPDTYFYTSSMSDVELLKRAHQHMQKKLAQAWQERSPDVVLQTPYEALILASIIEKEAALDEEREIISGVFQRRLLKNMRLQADPTVIYGLQHEYAGRLTREELKRDTPYNTYVHQGLPPTPIAMPGMKSIQGALHPDKGDALYFVAKGNGRHHFSVTLEEHNAAVQGSKK